MKRLLITGAKGQLGSELQRQAQGHFELLAVDSEGLDITDTHAVERVMGEFSPDAVINAAAYTAVDKAESEPEKAHAVNVDGPRYLAQACADVGARLLHVSTDFVFDGKSSSPYAPHAPTNPLSVYGRTKCEGELAIKKALPDAYCIVRTSWVYGQDGGNFVKTMLRLLSSRDELGVVSDQVGSPTSTMGLSSAVLALIEQDLGQGKVLHWTDAGVASWFDFAVAIRRLASQLWPEQSWATVKPIFTVDYPTPTVRPAYSVLDCRDFPVAQDKRLHWTEALRIVLTRISANL